MHSFCTEAPGRPALRFTNAPLAAVPAVEKTTRKLEDGAEATDALNRKLIVPLSSPTEVTALFELSTKLSVTAVCASTPAGATGNTDRTNPAANDSTPNRRIRRIIKPP